MTITDNKLEINREIVRREERVVLTARREEYIK